jgi:hypothetical protein
MRDHHSALEFELRSRHQFSTRAAARTAVAAWIEDYNHVRRHSALGMLSPVDGRLASGGTDRRASARPSAGPATDVRDHTSQPYFEGKPPRSWPAAALLWVTSSSPEASNFPTTMWAAGFERRKLVRSPPWGAGQALSPRFGRSGHSFDNATTSTLQARSPPEVTKNHAPAAVDARTSTDRCTKGLDTRCS